MWYIKLFIEREKNIGKSAPECPFKYMVSYHIAYLGAIIDSQLTFLTYITNLSIWLLSVLYLWHPWLGGGRHKHKLHGVSFFMGRKHLWCPWLPLATTTDSVVVAKANQGRHKCFLPMKKLSPWHLCLWRPPPRVSQMFPPCEYLSPFEKLFPQWKTVPPPKCMLLLSASTTSVPYASFRMKIYCCCFVCTADVQCLQ